MAKEKNQDSLKNEAGEQLDLIDVTPENAKSIIREARLYKKFQAERLAVLKNEIEQKHKVLELVKAAKLQSLDGGKIRFEHDGVIISITPRDELVKIKEKTTLEDE